MNAIEIERNDLRAQLAAVTKERDEARAEMEAVSEEADRQRERAKDAERSDDLRASACDVLEEERDALRADNATLLANADADALMLTQVGRERDEARELHARAVELGAAVLDNETKALKARVAALEAALAPTAENLDAYADAAADGHTSIDRGVQRVRWQVNRDRMDRVVQAIRARAGLGEKEGG